MKIRFLIALFLSASVSSAMAANSCAIKMTAGFSGSYWGSATPYHFESYGQWYNNPAYLMQQAAGATTPANTYYFNADDFGITCLSFPAAGDSTTIFGINAQIAAHTTAISNLQTQVTALTAGTVSHAPNPEIMTASGVIFGASLLAGALIWGLKRVYASFAPSHTES